MPRVIGRAVKVPAGVTVVAVLIGAALLGIVGALVAIPGGRRGAAAHHGAALPGARRSLIDHVSAGVNTALKAGRLTTSLH